MHIEIVGRQGERGCGVVGRGEEHQGGRVDVEDESSWKQERLTANFN